MNVLLAFLLVHMLIVAVFISTETTLQKMKIPVCKVAKKKKRKKEKSSAIAWIHGYVKIEHKK